MKKLILLTTLLVLTFAFGCDADDLTGGGKTKLALCLSLVDSYCSHADSLECDIEDCRSEGNTECNDTFTGDCKASAAEIFMFEDEMPSGWIESKTSCAGLASIYDSLETEVLSLASSPCSGLTDDTDGDTDGDTNNNDGKTNGAYCSEILGVLCDKIIELNCAELDKAQCMTNLFNSGAMTMTTTYTCSSSTDSNTPDDTLKSAFDTALSEAQGVSNCAEMGF